MTTEEKAARFDAIQKLVNSYTDNEITAYPWWAIVRRGSFGRHVVLVGPFFNRETAEAHRKARLYEYTEKSFVYCYSACYSKPYKELLQLTGASR